MIVNNANKAGEQQVRVVRLIETVKTLNSSKSNQAKNSVWYSIIELWILDLVSCRSRKLQYMNHVNADADEKQQSTYFNG